VARVYHGRVSTVEYAATGWVVAFDFGLGPAVPAHAVRFEHEAMRIVYSKLTGRDLDTDWLQGMTAICENLVGVKMFRELEDFS
jgi:hypothetical protein